MIQVHIQWLSLVFTMILGGLVIEKVRGYSPAKNKTVTPSVICIPKTYHNLNPYPANVENMASS